MAKAKPAVSKAATAATVTGTSIQTTATAVTLATIVAATLAGNFQYAPETIYAPLVHEGMAEINPEIKNEAGEVATRATQKGIDSMNTENNQANTGDTSLNLSQSGEGKPVLTNTEAPAVGNISGKSGFTLDSGIEMPTIQRGGRGGNVYPFDEMEKGQSFFVAATAAKPDPAKSLASTVSSATARYAVETDEMETVTVKTYKTDADGKRVKGEDGSFIVESTGEVTRPKTKQTRAFVVRSVVENNVKGARIWRSL